MPIFFGVDAREPLFFTRVGGVEGGVLMASAEQYRRRAADCLEAASTATSPKTQAFLRRVAEAWWHLAQQVENNKAIEEKLDSFPKPKSR